jgi:hypothetical protein
MTPGPNPLPDIPRPTRAQPSAEGALAVLKFDRQIVGGVPELNDVARAAGALARPPGPNVGASGLLMLIILNKAITFENSVASRSYPVYSQSICHSSLVISSLFGANNTTEEQYRRG